MANVNQAETGKSTFSVLDWSVQPKNNKEVVQADGKPAFEIPELQPIEGLFKPEHVLFIDSSNKLRLTNELQAEKDTIIEQRKAQLNPGTIFFDGQLVRLLPSEARLTAEENGDSTLVLPVSETSYFDYVVSRNLDPDTSQLETIAAPMGTCGVLTAKSKDGKTYMIYTVRTTKVETFSGSFHVVGGMLTRPDMGYADPADEWVKELGEEAGINRNEVEVIGSLGLAVDRYNYHPEITYKGTLNQPLEDIFDKNGVGLTPKRETDKEVELRAIPWEPDLVRALIVGEKAPNGDQDLRPWVPTGLANLFLAGRLDFGQEWYDDTMQEYRKRIFSLNQT